MPGRSGSGDAGVVLAKDPQLITLMLVTTSAGLTMFFSGVRKRRLQWRPHPREHRRLRHRRRL